MKKRPVLYTRLSKIWHPRPCCVCGEIVDHQEVLHTSESEIVLQATVMKDADGVDRCMFPKKHECKYIEAWSAMTQPHWAGRDAREELRKHWAAKLLILIPEIPPRIAGTSAKGPRTVEEVFTRIKDV